jgi:hypothetical protein
MTQNLVVKESRMNIELTRAQKRDLSSPEEENAAKRRSEKANVSDNTDILSDEGTASNQRYRFEIILESIHADINKIYALNSETKDDIECIKTEFGNIQKSMDFLSDKYDKQLEEIEVLKGENIE